MISISKEFIINQPEEKVWEVISNFGEIYRYHPEVVQSYLVSENTRGFGAVRKCVFNDGGSAIEKVIEWEEGSLVTVELSEMSMPLQSASGFTRVKSIDLTSSQVTIGMKYIFKYGLLGFFIGRFVMKPMLGKMFEKAARSIEHYISYGEKVS